MFWLNRILNKCVNSKIANFQIFGIDNISGKYHWIKHLPDFASFNDHQSMKIFVQRTSRHFPNPPLCVVAGRNKVIKAVNFKMVLTVNCNL